MDFTQIKELLGLFDSSDITELIIENEGFKIEIRKEKQAAASGLKGNVMETVVPKHTTAAPAPDQASVTQTGFVEVRAPMVGTFYRAPSPDAEPYVQIGDTVGAGRVLFIIEAMKMMNEIEAEINGVVRKFLVENGMPVEYGQPLLLIEPAE